LITKNSFLNSLLGIHSDNYLVGRNHDKDTIEWTIISNGGFANTLRAYLTIRSYYSKNVSIYWRDRTHGISHVSNYYNNTFNGGYWKLLSTKKFSSWVMVPPINGHVDSNYSKLFNKLNLDGLSSKVDLDCDLLASQREKFIEYYADTRLYNIPKASGEYIGAHIRTWYDIDNSSIQNKLKTANLGKTIIRRDTHLDKYYLSRCEKNITDVCNASSIHDVYLACDSPDAYDFLANVLVRSGINILKSPIELSSLPSVISDFEMLVSSKVVIRSKLSTFSHLAMLLNKNAKVDYIV